MKSMNLKRIATASVGAALLAASAATAMSVDETGLANFKLFNNAEPNVKIVVGAASMPSDAVAAANIAAMVGNLAYTSSDITVLGTDALSCEGGAASGKSVDVEVTTPGVNPNVAYQMKTYIEGFLDSDPIDDRANSLTGTTSSILAADGTSGGRKITNYEASALVNKATISDTQASRTYTEDERYFVYAKSQYDTSTKTVKAKQAQLGYETQFTNPIPVCTETVPDDTTCDDTYKTIKHRVKIKFLGADWIIYGMDNFVANGASMTASSSSITLGKEVQYKEFMQISDEATAPNGMKVVLKDISGMPYGASSVPAASFDIFDASGNKIDTATLQEVGTMEYNKNGIVIKVWKAFVGTGGSAYAQVSIFSDKLLLTHGTTVDTNNQQWTVNLVAGGTGYGASVTRIQLYRVAIDDLNANDFVTFIQKPQAMKLTYTGLEPVTYDTLTLATGSRSFPITPTDATTLDLSFVRLTSSLTNPFNLGTTSTNTVYWVTDGTAAGAGAQGDIFYQDPSTGSFSKFYGTGNQGSATYAAGRSVTLTGLTNAYMQYGNASCPAGTAPAAVTALGPYVLYNASTYNGTLTLVNDSASGFSAVNNFDNATAYIYNTTCFIYLQLYSGSGKAYGQPSTWADTYNTLPYTYGSNSRTIAFYTTGITGGAGTDPTPANGYAIAIPEFLTDSDAATSQGAFLYAVGDGSSASPRLGVSSGTTTLGYNSTYNLVNNSLVYTTTTYESGYISPRGSKATASLNGGTVSYATSLAHALYTLSTGATAGAGNVATPTLNEGDSALDEAGYKVVITKITAGATGGAIAGADGLACSSDQAYVVNALDTSRTPLVVTDTSGLASGTETMILVGGPLVNTLTAQVPGFATMSPGDAVVKVVGDKVVVAGYTAADTTDAANSLISWLASNKDSLVR